MLPCRPLTRKEAKRHEGATAEAKQAMPTRPEITATMNECFSLHRHLAVRSALATKPHLAQRVTMTHAICGSRLWKVELQDQRSRNQAMTESIETSVAEACFDERRRVVLAVLGVDAEAPSVVTSSGYFQPLDTVFARLLELPDPVVMEVLGLVMAETLAAGSELIETLGLHLKIDMADYWIADDAFYGLIRDREVLTLTRKPRSPPKAAPPITSSFTPTAGRPTSSIRSRSMSVCRGRKPQSRSIPTTALRSYWQSMNVQASRRRR